MTDDGAGRAPVDAAAAFERYVLPEVDVMFRVAMSLTRNRADAEDVVQDALVRAYRAIDRFDGRHPRAWLLTIVRNAHFNRGRRRRPSLLADPDAPRLVDQPDPDTSTRPEDVIVDPVFDEAVVDALETLPDKFREVVDLVDIGGLAYQEAADLLEIPVGTVMSRLHRARRRMRSRLLASGIGPHRSDHVEDPT